jgi:hypothetical protein
MPSSSLLPTPPFVRQATVVAWKLVPWMAEHFFLLRRKSWFLVAPIVAAVSFGVFLVYRTGDVLDEGQA